MPMALTFHTKLFSENSLRNSSNDNCHLWYTVVYGGEPLQRILVGDWLQTRLAIDLAVLHTHTVLAPGHSTVLATGCNVATLRLHRRSASPLLG